MKLTNIIQKAILSEKAYKQMEKGIYTFLVEKHATKKDVSAAVKNQFAVEPVKVNISRILPKSKRVTGTRKHTLVGGGKKAIVVLKSGQSISILSPKPQSAKKPKGSAKEKDIQKVSAEGKEA